MLSFKQFIAESIEMAENPFRHDEFPVSVGDRNISNAGNKLVGEGEDPSNVTKEMRIIFNPKTRKFYAFEGLRGLHDDVRDSLKLGNYHELKYFYASLKSKSVETSTDTSRGSIDSQIPDKFEPAFKKYFGSMKLIGIKFVK